MLKTQMFAIAQRNNVELKYSTVEALKAELSLRGEAWEEALSHPNLIQAVNQRVVFQEEGIKDGDEVAFFPPMTGG